MVVSLKHKFTSLKNDSADTSLVRPSNWNDEHDLTLATDRLLGRDSINTGVAEEIAVTGGLEFTGSGGIQRSAITGDVSIPAGSNTATIANDAVTYAKIQNVTASDRILGRVTAGGGDIEEITCTAAGRALLDDADAAAQRTTLGLGTLATQNGTFSGTSSGTNTGDQNIFQTIAVSGQSNVVADTTSDTLTLAAGTGVAITTNATTDTITIANTGVTSVGGTGTVNGLTLTGTVTTTGNLTLGGTLSGVSLTTAVSGVLPVANGGTGASTAPLARDALGLGTTNSPQFNTIELGNASDTTISRVSAGVVAVEGKNVALNGITEVFTTGSIELGNLTDTTITRVTSGVVAVEGKEIALNGTGETFTTGTIELGNASDTTITRSAAGRISVEGVNVALNSDIVGQQTIFVPAGAMTTRTTNGAASGTNEMATNRVMLRSFDFDTATQEFVQFAVQMPKGWNEGTLIAQFVWSHAATTTNFGVVWAIEAVAFADDDAADAAFGTAVQVADTGGTTNDIYITAETSAFTVAGTPGAEEWVVFQVKRVPGDASDTMAIDARLHGVKIHYTTDAAKDD